jgi:gamma-glutamyltranspeptidase/glutathione hydrolase
MTKVRPLRLLLAGSLLFGAQTAAAQAIVVSGDPYASAAGQEILRKGGSAVDAAMAIMVALTVTEPQASGIGGGSFFLYHDGKSGKLDTINGRETAPAAARPDRFLAEDGKPLPALEAFPGGKSVGIPGNIRLMALAHKKWGKLGWSQLFQPAIRLADGGFKVLPDPAPNQPYIMYPTLSQRIGMMAKINAPFADLRALYMPNGERIQPGTVARNPALAATLRKIAAGGPDAFYKGKIAAEISRVVATAPMNPATITAADLAGYKTVQQPATCAPYRGYKICGMGSPSSGAVMVGAILGMLERFDMKALGKDNPVSWHLFGEALRLAFADRDHYLGDAAFVKAPYAGMIDPAYVASRSQLISPDRTIGTYQPGNPPSATVSAAVPPTNEQGTTHIAVIDDQGSIVSMTSTVEAPFGSQLVAGGFILNNELTDFSFVPEVDGVPAPNRLEPGKRPLSAMSPTIVYDPQGKIVMAVGAGGGRTIIGQVVKAIIATIDWGLTPLEAASLPNIFFNGPALMVEQGTWLDAKRPELARLGENAVPGNLPSKINIIKRTSTGWQGVADPRTSGLALTK